MFSFRRSSQTFKRRSSSQKSLSSPKTQLLSLRSSRVPERRRTAEAQNRTSNRRLMDSIFASRTATLHRSWHYASDSPITSLGRLLACHSGRGVHRSPSRFRRDKNVSFEAILTRFDGSRADSLYNRLGVLWEADKVV
ncbi:hypothetical protein L596_009478 [Steinernema carpocapsae]|uniref:Uncharacterized protein n=1 Tax=Steinernema carpocapsae TaxID=34508 RepID=A0A4U5PFG6_STECR|nr:hypothetical protein L596_009478 [Steinernema carpocapsae]